MSESPTPLRVTGDSAVDQLLQSNPLALMIGMLLDQQIPIEWAFASPHRLEQRLGRPLSAGLIAGLATEELEAAFAEKPALHRFPASMAGRTQKLCVALVEHHNGDPASIWVDVASGAALVKRLKALPGFGPEKSKIFVALLAKRFGVSPDGWEAAAGMFADDDVARSVADVDGPAVLDEIRAYRALLKAEGKGKQGTTGKPSTTGDKK
jgi:uncharacterized HhH-GPD family protein